MRPQTNRTTVIHLITSVAPNKLPAKDLLDFLREAGSKAKLELIDRDVIEHRVWACQVDVLKDAGAELLLLPRGVVALLADELTRWGDNDHLTRLHITHLQNLER